MLLTINVSLDVRLPAGCAAGIEDDRTAPHHRHQDRDRRFFLDRHARRTIQSGQSQNAPGFCERAGPQTERLATNPIASLSAPRFAFILLRYMWLMIITHSVS